MFDSSPGPVLPLVGGRQLPSMVQEEPGDRREASSASLQGTSVHLLRSDPLLRKTFGGVYMEGATFLEKGKEALGFEGRSVSLICLLLFVRVLCDLE